eukprot:3862206-Pyramimonas_sp.AAC.1
MLLSVLVALAILPLCTAALHPSPFLPPSSPPLPFPALVSCLARGAVANRDLQTWRLGVRGFLAPWALGA